MASALDIANRALQKVGAARISSFDEGTREANAVKACYDIVRDAELSTNMWTFSIKRVELAPSSTTPAFGRTYQYDLPADYLRKAPYDPQVMDTPNDYLYEGRQLLTDEPGPLELRYVSKDVPPEHYDPLFAEALAARLAMEIASELTQSESQKGNLENAYEFHVRKARQINSIQAGPIQPDLDEWVYSRHIGNLPYGMY
jgi:hypothetical protein